MTTREQKILDTLIGIHNSINKNKGKEGIMQIIYNNGVSGHLSSVMQKNKIITRGGSKRNPEYTWNTIHPNIHMAKRLNVELKNRRNKYREADEVVNNVVSDAVNEVVIEKPQLTPIMESPVQPERTLLEKIVLTFPNHTLNELKKAMTF